MGLPQFGGEGVESYKGNKSDMALKQHGGEGKSLGVKGLDVGFTPKVTPDSEYCGPGRYLKTEQF